MFLIDNHRVLLNSAATALTSAIMGGLVFSLVGFYLISNSVSRDLQTGVGKLIAATPLSSLRYLAGKLAGNIVYLTAMATVFMIACMGMHLLRGEMPLEPIVFVQTFGIMFLPSIPCIAAIALMFECVPFLSGRGGDVLYFFFWTLTLALPPALVSASKGHAWILAADFTGLGFFVKEIISVTGAHKFTIGYAPYNAALSPAFFSGLKWISEIVILRLASVFFTIPFFGIAWAAFHRFDPARGSSHEKAKTGKIARLWRTVVSVWLRIVVPRGGWLIGPPSLVKAIALDIRLTLALYPVFFISDRHIVVLQSFGSDECDPHFNSSHHVFHSRSSPRFNLYQRQDQEYRAIDLQRPSCRQQFVALKFFSAFFSTALVGFIPLLRLSLDDPFGAAAALNGMLFMASAATFLGLLTGTPKTFVVMFLLFLYTAMSSKTTPAFDFAGLQGIATPSIVLLYAAASLLIMVAAFGFEGWRMKRDEGF